MSMIERNAMVEEMIRIGLDVEEICYFVRADIVGADVYRPGGCEQ